MKKAVSPGARDADTHIAAPSSASSTRERIDRGSPPTMPRWVIVVVILVILLVLVVVIIENTSNGMGNMQMSIPGHLLTITYKGQAL